MHAMVLPGLWAEAAHSAGFVQTLLALQIRNNRLWELAKSMCHEAVDRPVGRMLTEAVGLGLIGPIAAGCMPVGPKMLSLARLMRYVSP